MPKKYFIRAKLESIAPQRQQYRPYLFDLHPQDVYVEIEVSADQVLETTESLVVLNLDGFKAVLSKVADAVDEIHDEYVSKARRAGRF
jgi:hypothetical protein